MFISSKLSSPISSIPLHHPVYSTCHRNKLARQKYACVLTLSVLGYMVSYSGRQSHCRFLVEAASVIYLAAVTVDPDIFTWIKASSCRLHEAALTVFVQVLAQLAFGLWHGLLAADKCLFHIKTGVSIQWNSTLWLLLVGWLVPGKGGGLCSFFFGLLVFFTPICSSVRVVALCL